MQSDYFAWLSPVVPGASPATGDSGKRATAGMSPVSPVVPGPSNNLEGTAEPTEPCPRCGSGAYYRAERGGPWRCWACHPPERGPVALLTVPGGHVPAGEPQDAGAVLAEVAAAAGVPVARLKAALSAEDLADIAAGRVGVRELSAFGEHLLGARRGGDGNSAA